MLHCRDGSLYVGSTAKDPEARVWEHNNDEILAARYTIKRRPVTLVYVEEHERIDEAFARERQLHGWSRRKKLALIEGRADDLRTRSRSRSSPTAGRPLDELGDQAAPAPDDQP